MRWGFLIAAIGFAVAAVIRQRQDVMDALSQVDPGALVIALAASFVNVVLAAFCWRVALADLGSQLPLIAGARIFLLGQLGKYVPGSVWQVLASVEAGVLEGVPRRRTASALLVSLLVTVTSGLALGLAALSLAPRAVDGRVVAVTAALPALLAVLHPALLNPLLNRVLALARREPLERNTTLRGTAAAFALATAAWCAMGLQVYVLCLALGAEASVTTFALAVGGFSLAWIAGFVVVFAPAGVGVREVVLAAVLAGVLPGPRLLLVVLLSRVLLTLADLALAVAAASVGRGRPDVAGQPTGGRRG